MFSEQESSRGYWLSNSERVRGLVLLSIGVLTVCLGSFYFYYFELSHTFLEKKVGQHTILAQCEAETFGTFIPRVYVYIDNVKVLEVAVNEGYDFLGQCMISAVKDIKLSEDRKFIEIRTENNAVKTARIVYLPRS